MKKSHLLAGFALAAIPFISHAELYEVRLTASVNQIAGTVWNPSIQLGTPMTAVFVFDSTAAPTISSGTSTQWCFSGTLTTMSVGDYVLGSSGSHLVIYNNDANFGDGYQFDSAGATGLGSVNDLTFAARLWDYGNSASTILSTIAQPVQVFPTAIFPEAYLTVSGMGLADGSRQSISGNVASYTVSAIPEPSAYAAMAGAAVLGLTLWLRTRQRRVA